MSRSLEGKVAVVTGGGSGIGDAVARAFAREGAKVVVADINTRGGERTADMIKEEGGDAIFVRTDVSSGLDVEAMVNKTVEAYGRLDCACNNAGTLGRSVRTHEMTEEEWMRIVGVNLKGVWLCMKYELIQMLKQGKGAIVNMASIAGVVAATASSAYGASKHGVVGLTKTAAVEYAQSGIRINSVCPGTTRTPMVEPRFDADPEEERRAASRHPMGRIGSPEEIAEAVVWLCSDAASFVTGHALSVDGGYTSQ